MNAQVTIFHLVLLRQIDLRLQDYSIVDYYKGITFQQSCFMLRKLKDVYSSAVSFDLKKM